jgi:hypothetical protein
MVCSTYVSNTLWRQQGLKDTISLSFLKSLEINKQFFVIEDNKWKKDVCLIMVSKYQDVHEK